MAETREQQYERERRELDSKGWYIDVSGPGPGWHNAGELCQRTRDGEDWYALTSRVLAYVRDKDEKRNTRLLRNLAYLSACGQFCDECPWAGLCDGYERCSEGCLQTMIAGASIGSNVTLERRTRMAERSIDDFCKARLGEEVEAP